MLLMDITTFDPEMLIEASKRWELVESMELPKGLKIINQWFDAGGGRVITLYDAETVQDYMTYNYPFMDLSRVDVFPVMEAGEYKKFAAQQMEKWTSLCEVP